MDDALIESFNADHAQIQAGETKIQELRDKRTRVDQKEARKRLSNEIAKTNKNVTRKRQRRHIRVVDMLRF